MVFQNQSNGKRMKKYKILITSIISILIISIFILFINNRNNVTSNPVFDEQKAFKHIEQQLALGPRIPGSISHEKNNFLY